MLLVTSYLKYLLIVVFHFDAMLRFKFGKENSDAGHKRCRGSQVPHPCSTQCCLIY